MGTSRLFRLAFAALAAIATCSSFAACERVYSVGVSESGSFSYLENGQRKGLVPLVLAEVTRRTGCVFEMKSMPRARLWVTWKSGALDIVSGAVQSPERDQDGVWAGMSFVREDLVSLLPPPGKTLEGWLDLPQHPSVGRLRGSISGSSVDELLTRPQYAAQVEIGTDHSELIRKLFARRSTGAILARPAFELLAKELGFDPDTMPSHHVTELPRVPYGFYMRSSQVSAADRKTLTTAFETLLASGFNEAAYAGIVGKALATQIHQDK